MVFVLQDQYNVLCLGPTCGGKSTLLCNLTDQRIQVTQPTNGFNIKTLPIRNLVLSIKEIGGAVRLQQYWNQYYEKKQALLFVVNSAGPETDLEQARDLLRTVLADERLKDCPCLVLGTHSDLPDSRNDQQLEKIFAPVVQGRRWSVHCCCSFDRFQLMNTLEILIDMLHPLS